jgi:hypothetical protein
MDIVTAPLGCGATEPVPPPPRLIGIAALPFKNRYSVPAGALLSGRLSPFSPLRNRGENEEARPTRKQRCVQLAEAPRPIFLFD